MTDKKSNESRRKLLKSIAAGSGAIVAGKSLPENWSRPVVDSVMLPVHAQTSLAQYSDSDNASIDEDSTFAKVVDTLIPVANAIEIFTAKTCLTLNPDGHSVNVAGLIISLKGGPVQVTAQNVKINEGHAPMTVSPCTPMTIIDGVHVEVTAVSNTVATGHYSIVGSSSSVVPFMLPLAPCSPPSCPVVVVM